MSRNDDNYEKNVIFRKLPGINPLILYLKFYFNVNKYLTIIDSFLNKIQTQNKKKK